MRKILCTLLVGLLSILLLSCKAGEDSNSNAPELNTNKPSSVSAKPKADEQGKVDLFKGLKVQFSGYEWDWQVEFNTDNCDEFIKTAVTFSLETYPDRIKNTPSNSKDDNRKATVTASFDESLLEKLGYSATALSKKFDIKGIKEINDYPNMVVKPFSDGVAWVGWIDITTNKSGYCCIDRDGKVLFNLEGEYPKSNFVNNVAQVGNSNSITRIINKQGETIWSIDEDGWKYANEKWGNGSTERITIKKIEYSGLTTKEAEFIGYTFVEFYINSFDFSGWMTGVLNSDGEWHLEPTDFSSVFYLGNGIYEGVKANPYQSLYYNLITNELVVQSKESNKAMADWQTKFYCDNHDGLIFKWIDELKENGAFFDANNKKVFDLSKYKLYKWGQEPEFNEGYAVVKIENEQQRVFSIIIDKDGNEVCPPTKEMSDNEIVRCGYFRATLADYTYEYRKPNGESAFPNMVFTEAQAFYEDRAWVKIGLEAHLIDTAGNIII